MGKILLENIISEGEKRDVYIDGNVISRIVPAGTALPNAEGAEKVDCSGKVLLPGMVNAHTHAAMTLLRGVGEDICFADWIDKIWLEEEKIDGEFIYWATKVACLEMIKTGTTSFYDQYWMLPQAEKAVSEMGLRAVLSYVHLDHYDEAKSAVQKQECTDMYRMSAGWPDRISFSVAIHSVYSVSEELIVWAAAFAREHGLKINVHLCETEKEVLDCKARHGMSPVRYLDSLGVLGPDVVAAHTLWLDGDDIGILADRKVSCVHNINSNLKLASGYRFLYREMNDPAAMPLDELFSMATANGAAALGLNAGRVSEGCLADLIIVDTGSSFFLSNAPFMANFVYSAHSDCIDSVICDGKFLMRNRTVPGEHEILSQAGRLLDRIR